MDWLLLAIRDFLGPQGIGGFIIEDKLADSITPIIHGGTEAYLIH